MPSTRTQPLFKFYDVVQIVSTDGSVREIDRAYGIILGMAKAENGNWNYAVAVYQDEGLTQRLDGWSVDECNMATTGRSVSESFIHCGETLRVDRDGEPI